MNKPSNSGQANRERLFDIYAKNWSAVRRHSLAQNIKPDLDDVFVCPICFTPFGRDALRNEQVLTLDHVPPEALGGKDSDRILLCGNCNHELGSKLDSQLQYRMMAADFLNKVPGASIDGKFSLGEDAWLSTTLTWSNDQVLQVDSDKNLKRSNPRTREIHKERLELIEQSKKLDAGLSFSLGKKREWEAALLRIAYLTLFRTFGYGALVSNNMQKVRLQIVNPNDDILPRSWIIDGISFSANALGVNMIIEPDEFRSFLVVFETTTDLTTAQHAIVLPNPSEPGLLIYDTLQRWRDNRENIPLALASIPGDPDLILRPELCFESLNLWNSTQ